MKDLGREPGDDPLDVSTVMEFLRRDGNALSILQERHIWAMYDVARNNHLLASNFIPDQFAGDLLLFRATADRTGEEPPPEAWQPHVIGEIRIREVDCRHQLMTEPDSLAKIGSILRTELERTTATNEAPSTRPDSRHNGEPRHTVSSDSLNRSSPGAAGNTY